jgi:hypothetical protein
MSGNDWRFQCFDMLGDIADDYGASHGRMPGWFANGVQQTPQPSNQPAAASTLSLDPPRLVVALNSATVPDYKTLDPYKQLNAPLDFAKPGASEISFLVKHIYNRLKQPFVNEQGAAVGNSPWVDNTAIDDDEHWARRVSELFCFNAYMTPATGYSGFVTPSLFDDGNLVYKLQDENDPAYPIIMECQQTVTSACISRGYTVPVSTAASKPKGLLTGKMFAAGISKSAAEAMKLRPLPADPATAKTAKELGLVQWLDETTGSTTLTNLPEQVGPGSSFVFNSSTTGNGQEASAHPHTAFIIRLKRNQDKKLEAIQYFDVGGMNVPDNPRPLPCLNKAETSANHVYDYIWSNNAQEGAAGKFRGLTALGSDAAALKYALDQLMKTRPLGLARLILARRNKANGDPVNLLKDDAKNWLIYASPLLRMYEDDAKSNYAASRYAWSLRDLPGADQVQALWLISIPRCDLADSMVNGARTTPLSAMVQAVIDKKRKLDKKLWLYMNPSGYAIL